MTYLVELLLVALVGSTSNCNLCERHVYRVASFPSQSMSPIFGVNVLDFGANGTDPNFDNTDAFNKAINLTYNEGGGYVYVPTGQYLFYAQIIIKDGISLIGSYLSAPSHKLPYGPPTDGSVLMPHFGRNDTSTNKSFIFVDTDASIKGFAIYYPGNPCNNTEPIAYPPSIWVGGANAAAMDIELINSYIGIWVENAQRHYISKIEGQPTFIGIYVNAIYDVGRIENIHFNPWFCKTSQYLYFQNNYGRAFVFGRSDLQYIFDTFALGYAICYHFISSEQGNFTGQALGMAGAACRNASILVEALGGADAGITITNGQFTAYQNWGSQNTQPTQVIVTDSNYGIITFENSVFWGQSNNIARLYGNSIVTFNNCNFRTWDDVTHSGQAAIYANNGILKVIGSNFLQKKMQFELTKGCQKAIIANNILTGPWNVSVDDQVVLFANGNI